MKKDDKKLLANAKGWLKDADKEVETLKKIYKRKSKKLYDLSLRK